MAEEVIFFRVSETVADCIRALATEARLAGEEEGEFLGQLLLDGVEARIQRMRVFMASAEGAQGAGAVPSQHVLVKSAVESQFETVRLNLSNRS